MSRNPFSHPGGFDEALPGPQRLSGLSIASLVLSLLGCIPGFGLLALILGGAAIISISRSDGRLGGRTPAIVGVILGVLATVIWGALFLGARQAIVIFEREFLSPTMTAVSAADQGDPGPLRALLRPAEAGAVTDEDIAAFVRSYRAQAGAFVGMPTAFDWSMLGEQSISPVPPTAHEAAIPLPAEFGNGAGHVVLSFRSIDDFTVIFGKGGSLNGSLENFGVVAGGKEFWLIDPVRAPPGP